MPEEDADAGAEAEAEGEEEEDNGLEPGEVEEINEDTIKQLAAQAAGGGDDDEEEEDESDVAASAGSMSADVQVEKLKSSIDMLKEQGSSTMDRLQTISQNVGEIRQMVHEQETDFNEIEVDVDKMKDQLEDLDPQKLSKRMNEIQGEIESNEATIQKIQDKLERVGQTANDARETLKRLGSLDNLIEVNKEFEEKLDEIKEAERYIERLAAKSEKINIQINKKLTEYSTYKARVDAMQEKLNDTFRKLDETSIEVQDAVKEDELEQMRERVKELEEQLEEYGKIAPLASMALPEPIAELREERRDIESFLEELEDKYDRDEIEASKYEKIKDANEKKLETIRKRLVQEWKNLEGAEEGEEGGGAAPSEDESGGEDEDAAGDGAGEGGEDADSGEEEPETAADDYEEIVDKSVTEVQADVREMNLDIDKLIAAEKNGQNRDTLIEWLEDKLEEEEAEDEEEIDYDEIAGQSADEVKKAVNSKDLDLTELLKAERSGQNRNELLEWIEGKLTEG